VFSPPSFNLCCRARTGICGRSDLFNLDLGHARRRTAQVCGFGIWILGIVIVDGRLDSILGQHRAVQLDGWQAQLLCNLRVADLARLLKSHAPDKFGQVGRGRDGRAATKRLEFDI